MKKLVFIITDEGSYNNFLSELTVSLLSKNNYEVYVICSANKVINFDDKFNKHLKGLHFHYVSIPRGANFLKQISASIKIRKIIKSISPHLIHVHFSTAIFTAMLLRLSRYTYWGTFHGLGFPVTNGINKIKFFIVEFFSVIRLDKIILLNKSDFRAVSRFFCQEVYLHKSLGLGCDLSVFSRSIFPEYKQVELRNRLSIDTEFVLAYTGRFVHFKGFHILARTFSRLSAEHPDKFILLLIGGRDPVHNTGLSNSEEELFFSNKNVRNIGFTKEVASYLSITDLFIFPSKKEGMPICITEALAMGVPVLTINSRGCSELVKDGYSGFLSDINLTDEETVLFFYEKILDLKLDQLTMQALSRNALNSRNRLDRNMFIEESIQLYDSFLEK